jgi:toluene monooxygenase system protein A
MLIFCLESVSGACIFSDKGSSMTRKEDVLAVLTKLDWEFSYVQESEVFPPAQSGLPFLSYDDWKTWVEPFKTLYCDYVHNQHLKEIEVGVAQDLLGKIEDYEALDPMWLNGLKLHSATFPLAEFAAVLGNLRGARFGRTCRWRSVATFGALDEFRHTEIPLSIMHEVLKHDGQFDWTHRLFNSNNWVGIAGRHLTDELLVGSNAIEYAIATNFVFETGFTNLQFVGLSSLAHMLRDKMFEKMVTSIQSDEARHAQIGPSTLRILVKHDPKYAQYLLDKWFWRSWLLFAIVTGFCMDYMTPLKNRKYSFKEFMEEWVLNQYIKSLKEYGLKPPPYWDFFLNSLNYYHHMVYASAYTYRSSVWFDFNVPSPQERAWLKKKYPDSWAAVEPLWGNIIDRWKATDIGNDFGVHGTCIIGFCSLCQLVLSQGTPQKNAVCTLDYHGEKYIFCSEPCKWIFESEPHRYADHKDLVKKVLAGEAPGNLLAMVKQHFGLTFENWGKDLHKGDYHWMHRPPPRIEAP